MLRATTISILASAMVAVAVAGCGGGADNSGARSLVQDTASEVSTRDLVPLLTRRGVGPGQTGVDLTYAPPAFFELLGINPPAEMTSRPTLAFFMEEAIHEGALQGDPPEVFLELEDGTRVAPYSAPVTAEDPHHRTVRLLFPQPEGWMASSQQADGRANTLRLVIPKSDGSLSGGGVFEWQLPIDLDAALAEREEG